MLASNDVSNSSLFLIGKNIYKASLRKHTDKPVYVYAHTCVPPYSQMHM